MSNSKKVDLTAPIFNDDDAAREHLETLLWPNGPVCPRCGVGEKRITKLKGKSTRPGVYKCKDCRKPFSVTVGTVMERSKIPLSKWVLAAQLMASSKKGMSAKQLERMLGTNYETAWFLFHRLRECTIDGNSAKSGPMGGENAVVESDETWTGGKARNAHKSKPIPKKHAVVTLVERDGKVRAKHVPNVTAKTVGEHLSLNVDTKSHLMTDDSNVYISAGKKFAGHSSVNHSRDEYVRLGGFAHVNSAESFHALVKRSITGAWHSVSEHHLQRYINEISFRWNTRERLGFNDADRAEALLKGASGKRLTYHQPRQPEQV
jgi:transposase-like protein